MTVCFVFSTVTPKPTSDLVVFKRIIHQLAVDSVAEDGCIFYQILQTAEEPNIYYVLSKFRDMEALELHEQAPSRMTAMNNFLELARSDMNQKIAQYASSQDVSTMSDDSSFHRVGSVRLVVTVTVFDEPQFILLAQRLTNETLQEEGNVSYTFAKVTETVDASNQGLRAGPSATLEYMFIELFKG